MKKSDSTIEALRKVMSGSYASTCNLQDVKEEAAVLQEMYEQGSISQEELRIGEAYLVGRNSGLETTRTKLVQWREKIFTLHGIAESFEALDYALQNCDYTQFARMYSFLIERLNVEIRQFDRELINATSKMLGVKGGGNNGE